MNASVSTIAPDAPQSILQAPRIASATGSASASTSPKAHATSAGGPQVKTKKRSGAGAKKVSTPVEPPRVCTRESCKNVLVPGWRWRQCPPCRRLGFKRAVIVSCASCTAAVTVTASQAKSGEPTFCALCRQRALAAQAGIMLPQPPPFSVMGPPMTRPSAQHIHQLVQIPGNLFTHRSLLEDAMAFIHPDHLRAMHARDGAPPDPQFKPQSPAPAYTPPLRDATTIAPHYGPRGEILAILSTLLPQPYTMSDQTVTRPPVPLQSGHTRAESIVIPHPSDAPRSVQDTHQGPGLVTITLVEADPFTKDSQLDAPTPDTPVPKKKRRRTLAPTSPPQKRICASSSCGRTLSSQCQGFFCDDCGFLLWRKQFRARVAGISATVSAERPKVDKGKGKEQTVKQEPDGLSGTPVAGRTAPKTIVQENPPSDPSSSTSKLPAQLSEQACSESNPRPLTLNLPAQHTVDHGAAEVKPPATIEAAAVSDESMSDEDEEPLSVTIVRKRSKTNPTDTAVLTPASPEPRVSVPAPPEPPAFAPATLKPPTFICALPEQAVSSLPLPATAVSTPPLPPADLPPPVQSLEEQKPVVLQRPRIRLILHPPRPPPPISSESDEESSSEESSSPAPSRSVSASPLTFEHLQRRALLVWDSDESELTPIEDFTDLGESEVDKSESEDEVPPTPKDTDLVPQASWPSPKPPFKHRGICSVVRCMNLLLENSRLKCCHMCAARKRMFLRHQRHVGTVTQDTVEDEGMIINMPPDGDLTGFRNCNKKHCKRLIPPDANYKWKTCPPCRVDSRNRARLRRAAPLDLPEDGDDGDDDEEDIPLAAARALRKIASRAKKAAAVPLATQNPKPLDNSMQGKQLPVVPAYQHFAALLTTFRSRFADFTVAQALYLRYKAQRQDVGSSEAKARRNTIVFRFDGEYSIVADPSGGLVDAIVQCVVRNVQVALGLDFTPVAVNAGPESSVIAVLRCMYGAHIPLQRSAASASPKAEAKGESEPPVDKGAPEALLVRMVGELQVYVAWDRRHLLFPGQRIMMRFRLVG